MPQRVRPQLGRKYKANQGKHAFDMSSLGLELESGATGMRLGLMGCLAALTLGDGGVAAAHHSFAMFDQSKSVPLIGTVHDFQWTNPHAFIDVDVPNAAGSVDLWKVELNSPNNLKRQGWKSSEMKPGDKVTVVIKPLRDGSKGGLFVSVQLPDGKFIGDPTQKGGGPINVPQLTAPPESSAAH